MIIDKFSSHMELADRLLNELITAARTYGDDTAHHAADVLSAWDRTADADSRGSLLFVSWLQVMYHNDYPIFTTSWNPDHPQDTPAGLARPQQAVAALEVAAQSQLTQNGRLDTPWGSVYRLKRGTLNLPGSGAPGDSLGIFRVVSYSQDTGGQFASDGGDSYIAAVQFSTPIRAQVLLTYGNSSQTGSPHNGDQLELYAHNQMREAWLTRPEIQAHLASRDIL